MTIKKIILLTLLTSAFSACSMLSEEQYAHQKVERITVDSTQAQDKAENLASTPTQATTPTIVEAQSAAIATALGSSPAVSPSTTPPSPPPVVAKPSTAESVNVGGQLGLSINLPYQQVWAQTKTALPQAGYPVMEQDNTSGTYYILDKISTGGVIKRETPIYQLHLRKTGDNKTVVTINNAQNQAVSAPVAERILNALKTKF